MYGAVRYCAVLYCAVLYCTLLYSTLMYCTVLYCSVLYCTVLCCDVLCCTLLYYCDRGSTQLQVNVIYYTIYNNSLQNGFHVKTESVPLSKHSSSQLYKPVS
jgi:hypothetical protein